VSERFEVLVAGGGVATLEAMLTLEEGRAAGASDLCVTVLSDRALFEFPPMSVAVPFGRAERRTLDLREFCDRLDAELVEDGLSEVWPDRRRVLTASGEERFYDALLVAIGVWREPCLPGATTFRDQRDTELIKGIMDALEHGEGRHLTVVVPDGITWSLPAYELALMSAEHLRSAGTAAEVRLVTHEREALEALGGHGSERIAELAEEADVEIVFEASARSVDDGKLVLADGSTLPGDHVVALPALRVPELTGLNQGRQGFIPTDPWMRVDGMPRVWAAGDATWVPIKQGGLATQQAEVAAQGMLAEAGAGPAPPPFEPTLRGVLLTGSGRELFRKDVDGASEIRSDPLWWPPGKIVGRRLAPFLTTEFGGGDGYEAGILHEDRDEAADREDVIALSLSAADADARAGEYERALRWLDLAEVLDVGLSPEYGAKREEWRAASAAD
jgi:sulfide:quinone oxidoreductase